MIQHSLVTGVSDQHIYYFSEKTGIHKDVVKPWTNLVNAANNAGFQLSIASGYRSFERQLNIWNRKMTGKIPVYDMKQHQVDMATLTMEEKVHAIMTFSALPGSSRHHWGTDIDVYDPTLLPEGQHLALEAWEYQKNGPFAPLTKWLNKNAQKFGFYFPYIEFQGGVAYEPWHVSYEPLASSYLTVLTPDVLTSTLKACHIEGKDFIIANIEQLMNQYVYNINEASHG
ncbi:M15 family metallopeptidase [Thalassotalea sediminis]|uniref:M15 family metallopeptidase n=1 Tax=Thalassotalea sediminis TaxID=1759089 RepID=UPI0025729A45|nr:M15 family metallopeptidase [Thalassotalea sediminis]